MLTMHADFEKFNITSDLNKLNFSFLVSVLLPRDAMYMCGQCRCAVSVCLSGVRHVRVLCRNG